MTGPWEERLINLAEGGREWDLPSRDELIERLAQLRYVFEKVASEPGLTGRSGLSATDTFSGASKRITALIEYLEEDLRARVATANAERARAQGFLAQLSGGNLSPAQEAMVRGAAAGTTIVLGPLSILAGEGAINALNSHLGAQREEDAQHAVRTVSVNLDDIQVPEPPHFPPTSGDKVFDDPIPGGTGDSGGTGGTGGTGGRPPSFEQYPDFNVKPTDNGGDPEIEVGLVPEGPTDGGPDGGPDGPGGPILDLDPIPDGPGTDYVTPDGPVGDGISTLPGTGPGGGSGGSGGLGGGGGVSGGGLGVGLAAGAGGAAALARSGRTGGAGVRANGLGGTGSGKLGSGGASPNSRTGLSGGLLGKSGGTGGVGGTGGAQSAGAAGGRGGVMGGGGGQAGAAGGRSGKNDGQDKGRGLGGPIAPHLEDDEDLGPRSENAGAGGRE
ncbi:hypothetical protein ACFXP7_03735 [Microbacterium sp. P06]|uniref:hypothetical protein n=1 Tax=Microbacterium sp. P06 TaxID=3366949 RepID=UPI003745617D